MNLNKLPSDSSARSNAEVVTDLAEAINKSDINAARVCLDENLRFVGVFGSSDGAESYLKSILSVKGHQTIQKLFVDGDDVCVFYDLKIHALPNITLFGCGWFKLENKKIVSIRVVFDPTPLNRPKS